MQETQEGCPARAIIIPFKSLDLKRRPEWRSGIPEDVQESIRPAQTGRRMFMAQKRFIQTYVQGTLDVTEIFVDRETGVN